MPDKPLSPIEEEARLTEAANCPDCKRIWAYYSNEFCTRHSVAGWSKRDKTVSDDLRANEMGRAGKQNKSVAKPKTKPTNQKIDKRAVKPESKIATKRSWRRKIGIFFIGSIVLAYGLSIVFSALEGLGIYTPQGSEIQVTETSKPPKVPKTMPSITGKSYSAADDILDEICDEKDCEYFDLYLDRSVWDVSNWSVVDQAPPAGTPIDDVSQVCIGIVKNDEISLERTYKFGSSCPKSNSEAIIEKKLSWIPSGYVEDFDGFASDGTVGFQDCKFEGKSGRCAYYRYVTRDGLINGAFVKVQWLNSLNEVVDVSLFTTSGSVSPRGRFEFFAFLPNSTWDKPVSPRILGISG